MKEGDYAEIYHYTTGNCFSHIINDGLIKPATKYVPENEKPAVWFTFNPIWEPTANKLWRLANGTLVGLNTEQTMTLCGGLVRFAVDPKYAPHSWSEFVEQSGIDKKSASGLVRFAIEIGAKVEDWRVSFQPIERKIWLRVDFWYESRWEPISSP